MAVLNSVLSSAVIPTTFNYNIVYGIVHSVDNTAMMKANPMQKANDKMARK